MELESVRGAFMGYQTLTFHKRENIETVQVTNPAGAAEKMRRLSEELNDCSAEN